MRSIDAAEYAREIVALRELGPRPWVTWGCPWEALERLPGGCVDVLVATVQAVDWPACLPALSIRIRRVSTVNLLRTPDSGDILFRGDEWAIMPRGLNPPIARGQIVAELWPSDSALGRAAHAAGASYLAITPYEATSNAVALGIAL